MPLRFLLVAALSSFALSVLRADEPAPSDPYWSLVHDQTVLDDLKLTAEQQAAWRQVLDPIDLRAAKLETAAAEKQLTRVNETERDAVNAALTNDQKQRLAGLFARDFDLSKLGRTAFKAPELIATSQSWVNAPPPSSELLHDRVLVVHFFAFGCSNCIHNYPTYREWQQQLAGKDVQLVGIHTPETAGEHNVETL